jgi:hypothetical protein
VNTSSAAKAAPVTKVLHLPDLALTRLTTRTIRVPPAPDTEMSASLMSEFLEDKANGELFLEFRRKVREAEVLSASMERLLQTLHFSGRLSVVVHNGRVLKSGYEEGYFKSRADAPLAP